MRNIIFALFLAFSLILNAAGPNAEEMALYRARKNGAQAKVLWCCDVIHKD